MKSTVRILAAFIAVAAASPLSAQRYPAVHGENPSPFLILSDPLTVPRTHSAPGISAERANAHAIAGIDQVAMACTPNPFAGATIIHFSLDSPREMTITILDETGREVARPLDGSPYGPGEHAVRFDAAGLPSGRYFCTVSGNGTTEVRKIVVMR